MRNVLAGIIFILSTAPAFAQRTADYPRIRTTDATASTHDAPSADIVGSVRVWKTIFVDAATVTVDGTINRPPDLLFRVKWDVAGGGVAEVTEDRGIGMTRAAAGGPSILHLGTLPGGTSSVRVVADQGMEFLDGGAIGVSAANQGRLKYNVGTQTFQISANGSAFTTLASSGGAVPSSCALNEIPKWNGSAWACGTDLTGSGWGLTGNASSGTDFLGTTNTNDLVFKTNSTERGRFKQTDGDFYLTGGLQSTKGSGDILTGTSSQGSNVSYYTAPQRGAPSLPGATEGKIYFDSTSKTWKASQAGAAYIDMVSIHEVFPPMDAELPASAPAVMATRNNHKLLGFNDTTLNSAYWIGTLPPQYLSTDTLSVRVSWAAATATTGNVVWLVAIERLDTGTDIDADSFATAQTATTATLGTSGFTQRTTITFTNAQADTIVAGEPFRIRVQRDAANASDTMTGDAQVRIVEIVK